jgi:hypothetical protein
MTARRHFVKHCRGVDMPHICIRDRPRALIADPRPDTRGRRTPRGTCRTVCRPCYAGTPLTFRRPKSRQRPEISRFYAGDSFGKQSRT